MKTEEQIIAEALEILGRRLALPAAYASSPEAVRQFLMLKLGAEEREVFAVVWLDTQLGILKYDELFFGTLNATSVYPREVVKSALRHNAASVVLVHNHPSGYTEPSQADIHLTSMLSQALGLIDVRVIDHIIVSGNQSLSFRQRGLL